MRGSIEVASGNSERKLRNDRAFDVLAQSYDTQINPLLLLEKRYVERMLPEIAGRDVVGAYASADAFDANNAITPTAALAGMPVARRLRLRPPVLPRRGRRMRIGPMVELSRREEAAQPDRNRCFWCNATGCIAEEIAGG
jgi:hypothetical protein